MCDGVYTCIYIYMRQNNPHYIQNDRNVAGRSEILNKKDGHKWNNKTKKEKIN